MPNKSKTATPTCDVHTDVGRNLIRIRYHGHVTPAGMKPYVEAVKAQLPELRAGFTVLADFSGMDSMDVDCVTGLTRIMDACRAHGVAKVIRIIPDPNKDIGLTMLGIVHYRGSRVHVVTCHTAAEAEQLLPA